MSCQPARGDPLGPGTPELAFSDNPLIYSARLGMAASDREAPGQVLSGDLARKMKPGWGVRVCGEEDTAWQGTRVMAKQFLTRVKLPWPRDGREQNTESVPFCCHQCSFVPAGLKLLEPTI